MPMMRAFHALFSGLLVMPLFRLLTEWKPRACFLLWAVASLATSSNMIWTSNDNSANAFCSPVHINKQAYHQHHSRQHTHD